MQTSPTSQTPQLQQEGAPGKRSLVPIVEVQNLRKVYQRLLAIDDISFVMYRGEAFGFLGPNGRQKYRRENPDRLSRPYTGTIRG